MENVPSRRVGTQFASEGCCDESTKGSWLLEPAEVPQQATEFQNNSKTASLEHAVRCQPRDVSGAPQRVVGAADPLDRTRFCQAGTETPYSPFTSCFSHTGGGDSHESPLPHSPCLSLHRLNYAIISACKFHFMHSNTHDAETRRSYDGSY